MSKLGLNPEYMGTLANDNFGKSLLNDFTKYHIGSQFVRVVEDSESFHAVVILSILTYQPRTCVWNKGTVPAPVEEDINLEALKSAALSFSGWASL